VGVSRPHSSEHSSTQRSRSAASRRSSAARRSASRRESKELTRQALLRAALKLLSRHSFDSISLREVTREAGVSPTAFYRHFDDMEELGLILVEDSLGSLRQMIRGARSASDVRINIAQSVEAVAAYTAEHEAHLRFIARERYGGVRRLRKAIRRELQLFVEELAVDLAPYPELGSWSTDDRRMLAGLLVEAIVHMAVELMEARDDEREWLIRRTERQLLLILLGVGNWRPGSGSDAAASPRPAEFG
jgi:AcrR family transcriptional regulator